MFKTIPFTQEYFCCRVVFFRDCSFNEGRDYITNTKGIVTKIEKTAGKPPSTLITFAFFEGRNAKSSITLNSRQLRKIEITGKDFLIIGLMES
jgi:hypothetical protein